MSGKFRKIAGSTIYALSTNPGKSAIAIIRISGPNSLPILKKLGASDPKPRSVQLSRLHHPNQHNIVLDHALTLYFKKPSSYTGEDVVELHLHGGNAVVKAVLKAIGSLHRPTSPIRYAEPGEFTYRAFRNGRLDLTQVEGIKDIIDAETEYQRQAAISNAGGQTRQLYESWRQTILNNIALMSVIIDFTEDNIDIQEESRDLLTRVTVEIKGLLAEIRQHLKTLQSSELLQSGFKMNFMGLPNAGKSSLLNSIIQRDASIVSEIPGTTRDVIEVAMDIKGYKIIIGDTAGLRNISSDDPNQSIEAEGIKRARQRINDGDIVLIVVSVDNMRPIDLKRELDILRSNTNQKYLIVLNKIDLIDRDQEIKIKDQLAGSLGVESDDIVSVSSLTGANVDQLVEKVAEICGDIVSIDSIHPYSASQRVKDLLCNEVETGLEQFIQRSQENEVVEAISELQHAANGIGKITGKSISVDEVLGVIFGNFCIGK